MDIHNEYVRFFHFKEKYFARSCRDASALPILDEVTDELWVEKFAPRAFCDLLSDIVSRNLLPLV